MSAVATVSGELGGGTGRDQEIHRGKNQSQLFLYARYEVRYQPEG